MLFELVTVACVAFATAGVALAIFKVLRKKPNKTIIIGAAGIAMIAFTAWNRHGWAARTEAQLPPTVEVIQRVPYSNWLEPWTLIRPRTGALVAIDRSQTLRNPMLPDVVIVSLLNIEPRADTLVLRQIVDCANRRRASLKTEPDFTTGDLPAGIDWITGGTPKYLYDAACKGVG